MTTTWEAIARIGEGALKNGRNTVDGIKQDAMKQKPHGFDAIVHRFREHYEGQGAEHVRAVLMKMHKSSGEYIRPIVYNWAHLMASTAASVYDVGAKRYLTLNGEKLDDADPREEHFERVLHDAQIIAKMPEAERRAQLVKSCIVAVRARKKLDDDASLQTAVELDLHWPSDVWVIPHPSAPASWELVQALLVACAYEGEPAHELWTREAINGENGLPESFGPWKTSVIKKDGKQTPVVEYKGKRLPFCLLSFGMQSDSVWPRPSKDEVDLIETLNAQISDRGFLSSSQMHSTVVYKGSKVTTKSELAMGPNDVIAIDDNEDLSLLQFDARVTEMKECERENVRLLAMTKRQSVEAYTADVSSPASGVARLIANEPQTKAREESALVVKAFEEKMLLPVIIEVADLFVEGQRMMPCRPAFEPSPLKEYEDPAAKLSRALTAKDAGLISEARAAVEAGLYASIEDAMKAGLLDTIGQQPPLTTPQGSVTPGSRILERMSVDNVGP